jgi:putative ABC transport system permease protein
VDDAPDAWSPLVLQSSRLEFNRAAYDFRFFGRLKQGVTGEMAESELAVLAARRAELLGGRKRDHLDNHRVRLVAGFARIPPVDHRDVVRGIAMCTALLTLVLLVACANIANLMMARAADRQREIGIRQALGASRARLVRQILTESVLLALLGGAAAVVFGHWTMALVRALVAWSLPEYRSYILALDFVMDWRVIAYAIGLSLFSGVLFGLAPAFDLLRANLAPALKQEGSPIGTRLPRASLRNILLIGQVAVSLCLTIIAGLIARTSSVGPSRGFGFTTRDVLFVQVALPNYGPDRARVLQQQVMEKLAALPGVESLGLTSIPNGGARPAQIVIDGGTPQPFNLGFAGVQRFSPGYFETLKIPILQGRNFTEQDLRSDAPVVIVSDSMAKRFWPNGSALGQRLSLGPRAPALEVVGITRDATPPELRNYMGAGGKMSWFYSAFARELYLPLSSNAPDLLAASLVLRVSGKPKAMIPLITKEVQTLDRNASVSAETIHDMMTAGLAPFIACGFVGTGFGLLTTLLAMMGIYGVMAYVVRRRTQEIGVRMALGARPGDVLRMVIGQGMGVVAIGAVIGFLTAAGLARLMASKLFGMSPLDPLSFLGVSSLSLLAALLACYLPAKRAAKVDPIVALRYE